MRWAGNDAVANHAVSERPAIMRAPGVGYQQIAIQVEDGIPVTIVLNGPRRVMSGG
jgi:hypothetical protein